MAFGWLRQAYVWRLGLARHPMIFRIKCFPAKMWVTSFVRRVRLQLRLALEWSWLSALQGGDLWKIACAVPLWKICQDSEMTSAKRILAPTEEAERKKCQGPKNVQTNSRQQEGLSRFRDDKGKPDQEKVASQEKDVESKKRQGERVPRADRVNGRDKQAVRCRSLRLFILFLGSSPFETSVARALLALFCV